LLAFPLALTLLAQLLVRLKLKDEIAAILTKLEHRM
jgi:hypothetical protein